MPEDTRHARVDPAAHASASAFDALLASLNPQQHAAASHDGGPLLIVAGAGTGKTTTLAHRVAYLIANGTDPGSILLLTFTRRAAAEMLRRVDALLCSPAADVTRSGGRISSAGSRVWGGTFHAVAARLLRIHGRHIGLEPEFSILDRGDAEDLMHVCRTELALGDRKRRFPQKGTCLDIYSRCVNTRMPLEDVLSAAFPWCRDERDDLARLFDRYTERKESAGTLDYDDLLVFWLALMQHPEGGSRVRERFAHVLVDEYQDTNTLQAEILSALAAAPGGTAAGAETAHPGATITAVGDDAQSIYAFRGATVRNILEFEQRFKGATVVTLEQNYRSTRPILEATNLMIAEAAERRDKWLTTTREGGCRPHLVTCRDEPEQCDFVIDAILDHRERGVALKRQAVLFRTAHHSAALEVELARRNVPFVKFGGLKFVEMAHIKDLLGYLRLAENPRDRVAGLRVLALLPGIGPRTAAELMDRLDMASGDFETAWVGWQPPEAAGVLWPGFVSLMRGLSADRDTELSAQVHAARTFYAPLLAARYDAVEAREGDLAQIEALASRYPTRERLLTELALDPPSYTEDFAGPPLLDEDYLILSTIHSAKGLEFDAVYVIHAADGNIPSDMATGSAEEIEEERRLFYVACTRARDDLYITWPLRYYAQPFGRGDVFGLAQRTRFITNAMRPLYREVYTEEPEPDATSDPDSAGDSGASAVTTPAQVRSELRRMWA